MVEMFFFFNLPIITKFSQRSAITVRTVGYGTFVNPSFVTSPCPSPPLSSITCSSLKLEEMATLGYQHYTTEQGEVIFREEQVESYHQLATHNSGSAQDHSLNGPKLCCGFLSSPQSHS